MRYLGLEEAVAVHGEIMRRLGAAPAPLRDPGGLESALSRPKMEALYAEADLVRQAATLAVGVSQIQAFLDGNKRTAYAVLDVFLRLNSFAYGGDPIELARQLELVAERTDSLAAATDRFETWLRACVVPLE